MKPIRILILESNAAFAEEMKNYFSAKENYTVCGVTDNGQEGIELIKSSSPDIVVLSLYLKNLDGFTVMEEARREERKTEFIVTGNFTEDRIINQAIGLGAKYYLMKPVEVTVLGERVSEVMEESEQPVREGMERRRAGSIEERISKIFISIGIPPHIKGYGYLREGIKMAVEDPRVINNVTKELYPKIGKKYETTASKVERAIRHAIEVGWNRGRIEAINAVFGARVYLGAEKPTNSEFIALVADKLLLEDLT